MNNLVEIDIDSAKTKLSAIPSVYFENLVNQAEFYFRLLFILLLLSINILQLSFTLILILSLVSPVSLLARIDL